MLHGGRPTKYLIEYCDQLISHMGEGLSFESFAGLIGTCKATLYNWEKAFPEFLEAHKRGEETNRLFYEQAGRQIMLKGKGNAACFIFNMKNRFKWTDRSEVSSPVGQAPITVKIVERGKED